MRRKWIGETGEDRSEALGRYPLFVKKGKVDRESGSVSGEDRSEALGRCPLFAIKGKVDRESGSVAR